MEIDSRHIKDERMLLLDSGTIFNFEMFAVIFDIFIGTSQDALSIFKWKLAFKWTRDKTILQERIYFTSAILLNKQPSGLVCCNQHCRTQPTWSNATNTQRWKKLTK